MDVSIARSSRRRLIGILGAVAAAHATVLLTSEVEGPGSAQLRAGSLAGQADGRAAEPAVPGAVASAAEPAATAAPPTPGVAVAPAPTVTAIPTATAPTPSTTVAPAAVAPTVVPSPTVVRASPTSGAATALAPAPATATSAPTPDAGYAPDPTATARTTGAPTAAPATPLARASPPPVATAVAAGPAPTAAPVVKLRPTETMPGGRNNYVAGAPFVPNLGTGFVVSGSVLDATGKPVRRTRIQIWLNTVRGGEREPSNRGSVMTDDLGKYRLDTSPVVPVFGQPHVHIGYDDGVFDTLFLRPVLTSEKDPSIVVDFVLNPRAGA